MQFHKDFPGEFWEETKRNPREPGMEQESKLIQSEASTQVSRGVKNSEHTEE